MFKAVIQQRQAASFRLQRGASLIIVMLIMVIVSLLGVGSAQVALMSERGARNDRDQQVAWQAAEAALMDAEADIFDNIATNPRKAFFDGKTAMNFVSGCGTSGNSRGLCTSVTTGKPSWLAVDFTSTGTSAPTTAYGTFTGRSYAAGGSGIKPAQAPRYVIELVPDPMGSKSTPSYLYRITAMGFGPRADTQAVLQILYRK